MSIMTVSQFAEKYGLSRVSLPDPDKQITGGYVGDLLSWVMGRAQSGDAWITIMSNINIAAVAALTDAACVIIAEGVTLGDNIIEVASSKGINILASEKNAFELAGMLHSELR